MKQINLNSLEALLSGYWLSDLPNFASYIYNNMENLNWIGFYLSDGKTLRLGPFMGNPACLVIPYDKGVCGKAYSLNQTVIVDDVHLFSGHISCDAASESEMVIPLIINQKLVGVLDIDSPIKSRFSLEDKIVLEKAVQLLAAKISENTQNIFGRL